MARSRKRTKMSIMSIVALAILGCSSVLFFSGGSSMAQQLQFPPARTVAVFDDGEFTEFFAVTADARRQISTIQFYEDRPDLGEIKKLKEVPWDMSVPADAELFIATSGVLRDKLKVFWIGWREKSTISACSLLQENPIQVEVAAGAEYVYPPVVLANRKLNLFFWQDQGGHRALMRHEFSGNVNEPGRVATSEVIKVSVVPKCTTLAAVSGDDKNSTVLGWLESRADSMALVALVIEGGSPKRYETPPLHDLQPLERQKPAVQLMNDGSVAMLAFARDLTTSATVIVEARLNSTDEDKPPVQTHKIGLEPGMMRAGAAYFYPDADDARAFTALLDSEQRLHIASAEGELSYVLHENLPADYDFPMVTSYDGRYEARLDERNSVKLVTID